MSATIAKIAKGQVWLARLGQGGDLSAPAIEYLPFTTVEMNGTVAP